MPQITDLQKIGIGLSGFGVSFVILGVLLFFDRGLLAIGNILFISGITLVIGIEKAILFFFQYHKLKATSMFLGGVSAVLLGWTFIGLVVELYGFVLLFTGLLPSVLNFVRRVPLLCVLLSFPGLNYLAKWIGEPQGLV